MRQEEAKILIEYINESDYEPNDWESNFIESILNQDGELTKKQASVLENIYAKATDGGIYERKQRI